jgi:hypothetical protein
MPDFRIATHRGSLGAAAVLSEDKRSPACGCVAMRSSEAPLWRVESDRPDGHPRSGGRQLQTEVVRILRRSADR